MANNQGFAAVVGSIERLRDSLIGDASRRAAYGRTRLSEQRRQTKHLQQLETALKSQPRDSQGRFASTQKKQERDESLKLAKRMAAEQRRSANPSLLQRYLSARMTSEEAVGSAQKIAATQKKLGKSTNDGFGQGLKGKDLGQSFGDDFIDSLKKSLGINSPSKAGINLGKSFAAGWAIGLKSMGASTDEALEEQGKKFRKQLRKQIIDGRDRDAKGRFTQKPVKQEPVSVSDDYWGDVEHSAINAYQTALEKSYARDVGPSVQDWVNKLFGGNRGKAESETIKEIRKRKKSLLKAIAKESELSTEEQQKLALSRKQNKTLSPAQRYQYLSAIEKRPDLVAEYGEVRALYPEKRNVEDMMALRYYTKPAGYREMNMVQRGQVSDYQQRLREQGVNRGKKRIVRESQLSSDSAIAALNELPSYEGKSYRGLNLSEEEIAAIEAGGTYKEKGFFSTTKNKAQRYPGNVVFEVNSTKAGKDVSDVEAYKNNEVLFAPNSEFDVKSKRKVDKLGQSFWVIELEDKNAKTANFVGGDAPTLDINRRGKKASTGLPGTSAQKEINISTRAVFITAETVTITPKGGDSEQEQTNEITGELQKLREEIKTNGLKSALGGLVKSLVTGMAIAFAQSMKDDFFVGLKGGLKERSSLDFEQVGGAVGRFVGNPLASAKETIKARKVANLDGSLAEAEAMARREDVQMQEGKVKVFTAGGLGGPGFEDYTENLARIGIDPTTADIENTTNPYSSTTIPLSDPLNFASDAILNKYVNNEIIQGRNRDAIRLASKVIAARKKDPNAKINLVGHSGGADIVQQAIAILEKGGYADNVQGIGVGGVDYGTGFDTQNYVNIAGEDDYVRKLTSPLGSKATARDFGQVSKLGDHSLRQYFSHPDFIKSLDPSLQAEAVAKILDQFYQDMVTEYGEDARPLLEEFLRDGQKFAEEFNQQFTEEETAKINEILARYNATRTEIAGDTVAHGGIKAAPPKSPTMMDAVRGESQKLSTRLVSAIEALTKTIDQWATVLVNRPGGDGGDIDDPWGYDAPNPTPPSNPPSPASAEADATTAPPPRRVPIDWQDPPPREIPIVEVETRPRPREIPIDIPPEPPRQIPIEWQDPPPPETEAQRRTRLNQERLAKAQEREAKRAKEQERLAQEIGRQDYEIDRLKEEYIKYLYGLVQRSRNNASRDIPERISGYSQMSSTERGVLADREYRSLEEQMGGFRDIAASGDLVALKVEAERLIPLIEQSRRMNLDAGRQGVLAETRNQDLNALRSELLQGARGGAQVGVVSALNLNTKAMRDLQRSIERMLADRGGVRNVDPDMAQDRLGIDVPTRNSPVPEVQIEEAPLLEQFATYLLQIQQNARDAAEQQVEVMLSGFRTMTTQGKKDFAKSFSTAINQRAAEYRKAIADGQKQLANELGIGLLQQIQSVRKIYDTILSDPASQNIGRKSIQGMKGNLTAVENEVLRGQPNMRGRSPEGLLQNLESAQEMAAAGDNAAQSFIDAVLANVTEALGAGAAVGDALAEGTEDSLDISSPSKRMQEIGEWAIKGFARGINETGDILRDQLSIILDKMEQIPFVGFFVKLGRQAVQFFERLLKRPERGYQDEWKNQYEDKYGELPESAGGGKQSRPKRHHRYVEQIEVTVVEDEPAKALPGQEDPKALPGGHIGQKILGGVEAAKEKLQEQVENLQGKYAVYLKTLMDKAAESIEAAGLDPAELQSQVEEFRERIKKDLGHFRQAVAEGANLLAVQVGEGILAKTAALKATYGELGKDATGTEKRSLAGKKGAATKQQNEVIKGGTTKNSAPTGLWDIVGEDTSDGFVQAILSRLDAITQAGVDLGEAAIAGAKKALGIESPSKVFYDLGQWVVDGFNKGMKAFGDEPLNNIVEFTREAKEAVEGEDPLGGITEKFQEIKDQLGEGLSQVLGGTLGKITAGIAGMAAGIGIVIGAFFALKTAFEWITNLTGWVFESVVAFESLNRTFLALTGSSAKAQAELKYVGEVAQRLGVDLKAAEQAYAGLMATTRGTAIEGTQTKQIFEAFAQTASVRGLSTDEQGRMFAAIQQMLGKGKVSAEEVRGQLGEIAALDFQGTLARSMGIGVAQLDEAMSSGSLQAADVLPKVAAQYAAENAVVAGSSTTAAQAIANYDNAVENFKRNFIPLAGIFKTVYEAMAQLINWASAALPPLLGLLGRLSIALSVVLIGGFLKLIPLILKNTLIMQGLTWALGLLRNGVMALGKAVIANLGPFILLQLVIEAWGAALYVTQNRFTEYASAIKDATKAAEAHEKAVAKLNNTQSQTQKALPTDAGDIITDRGWFGGRVKLDPVRKALGITTLGEQQMNDFIVQSSGQMLSADQTVMAGNEEKKRVEQVLAIEEQLNVVRSRRFENIAGDRQAYEKSVEEEKKLLAQREDLVAATSAYGERLTKDITATEQALSDLDALVARGGITRAAEQTQRAALEDRLGALKEAQQGFDKLVNSVQMSTNALSRELEKISESMSAFSETLERISSRRRIDYLTTALQDGTGSAVRGVGLANLSQQEAQQREAFLQQMLGQQETLLQDDQFAKEYQELERQLLERGLEMNLASLERVIGENRDPQTTAVAELAKRIIETRQELQQTQEAIAQNAIDLEESVFGLTRQVNDFFQNLTQQIVDAQFEIAKATNQLKSNQLKLQLQRALVPGSNSFLNGVVQSIQGLFDEAAGVLDSILGSQQRRFQLAGANYSLENQMQDFQRSVAGATEAVNAFRASLGGGTATTTSGPTATATTAAATGGRARTGRSFSGTFGQETVMSLASQFGLKKNSRAGNHFGSRRTRGNPGSHHRSGNAVDFGDLEQGVGQRQAHKKFSDFVSKVIADGTATHIEEIIWNGHGSPLGDWFATSGKGPFYKLANGKKVGINKSLAQSHADHLHIAETTRGGDPYVTVASNAKAQPASTPTTQSNAPVQTTKASFYGGPTDRKWHGRKTASGEVYDENGLTVAVPYRSRTDKRPSIPFGTYILVTNPANGKQVVVRVTDTGNFGTDPQYGGRGLDLSYGAAQQLGTVQAGVANVNYQVLGKNPPSTTAQASQAATTTPSNDPVVARARQMATQMQGLNLDLANLSDADAALKVEQLVLTVEQWLQSNQRGLRGANRDFVNQIMDARNSFAELGARYSGQTLTNQAEADAREIESTFRNLENQLAQAESNINDELQAYANLLKIPEQVKALATPEQLQLLQPSLDAIGVYSRDLEPYMANLRQGLEEIQRQKAELGQLRQQAEQFYKIQQEQRSIQQELQAVGLESEIAQASGNNEAKLQSELRRIELNRRSMANEATLSMGDRPEDLEKYLANLQKSADISAQRAVYERETADAAIALEIITKAITRAEFEGNEARKMQLEMARAAIELKQEEARINLEVFETDKKRTLLQENRLGYLNKIEQIERDFSQRQIERADLAFEREQRFNTNAVNLERNPYTAATMQQGMEEDRLRAEFAKKEFEILNDPRYGTAAEKQAAIAREADILAQNLALVDRQFLDLTESIGMGVAGAFNSFFDALLRGENALQAFGNALMESLMEIGKNLINTGVQSLVGGLFGFSEGGYTGPGGKYKPAGIVHAGEYVLNKEATRELGLPLLNALNQGIKPGYALGGLVSPINLESNLLSGINSVPNYKLSPSMLATSGNGQTMANGDRRPNITIEQNFHAPVDRFNASASTLAREQAEAMRRAIR